MGSPLFLLAYISQATNRRELLTVQQNNYQQIKKRDEFAMKAALLRPIHTRTKIPTKGLTANLPNVKRAVGLFTQQRQPAETLMEAGVFLAHHQSEFALYFERILYQYNTW